MDTTNSNSEDLRFPSMTIMRLIKEALPPNVTVAKEAKTAIARSAAIFVVHATNYANEYAVANKRRFITAVDVLHAIKVLECEELEKPLKEAVEIFKKQIKVRNEKKNKQKKERLLIQSAAQSNTANDISESMITEDSITIENEKNEHLVIQN